MKTYRVYQVDAFTKERFHGNPAGVVTNADGLTERQMQQIAREINNSETAFIFSSDSPSDYDVEVRFFTPTMEVPICGHATIAAHYVRAREGVTGVIRQKTKAGILPVEVVSEGNDFAIIMTQGAPEVHAPLSPVLANRIIDALGIGENDRRIDCPIAIASSGHAKIMVGIRSNQVLHALRPNMTALAAISEKVGCNGYYVFTLNPQDDVLVHGRMFAPLAGIPEDPVTGNANGPLGLYLVHYGVCREKETAHQLSFRICQGEAMHRDGGMRVDVSIQDGRPTGVQIVGKAVVVFETTIDL